MRTRMRRSRRFNWRYIFDAAADAVHEAYGTGLGHLAAPARTTRSPQVRCMYRPHAERPEGAAWRMRSRSFTR